MFERFHQHYRADQTGGIPAEPWFPVHASSSRGFAEFASQHSGASFNDGVYRFHDSISGTLATELIGHAFPAYSKRIVPFGVDWLGRQFACDLARLVNGQPQTLLFEPGTGFVLEIPVDFVAFHDDELVDEADAAVARSFFAVWAELNADSMPIARDQCVGYDIPLFLGGEDAVGNLSLTDLEVYWVISAGLRAHASALESGTAIGHVRSTDGD